MMEGIIVELERERMENLRRNSTISWVELL